MFCWLCHPFEKQTQDKPCSDIEVNNAALSRQSVISQEDISAILDSS